MVSFWRHVLIGLTTIGFSLWWNFVLSVRHVHARMTGKKRALMSTTTQPAFFMPTKFLRMFPFESYLKILISVLIYQHDISVYRTSDGNEIEVDGKKLLHGSWYFLFTTQAVVEILMYHRVPFPHKSEYYFFLGSTIMYALGWTNHVGFKTDLDYTLHLYVSFVLVAKMFAIFCEIFHPFKYWPVFVRCVCTFMEGAWFVQIAFTIYPHTENHYFQWKNDVYDKIWLENLFLIYMVAGTFILFGEYFFVYFSYPIWKSLFDTYDTEWEEEYGEPQESSRSDNEHIQLVLSQESML